MKNTWNQTQIDVWYAHWIDEGFTALEQMLQDSNLSFMNEMYPCVSDICLVAQIYNANRFNVPLHNFPRLLEINQRCMELPAFKQAAPEAQLGEVE